MAKPIPEQVIVIVGASSGIGLLTAQTAAAQGAKVVLASRNTRDLDAAVREIMRLGGSAIGVTADVSEYEQVERVAERAVGEFGRIDTWVNNAAVSLYGYVSEVSLADVRRIMDVNFMGQVHGIRAALPHLEQTQGTLICVGSALSDRGVPLQAAYCASKHALKGFLDGLRVELRNQRSRVRVTLVKPSSINTPLFNKAKTHLGVMPRPIPPIYEPELAAAAILHAATHHERDVYVGGAGKLFATVERLNPKILDVQQLRQGFAGQKTDWPKPLTAPSNLHEPVEHDGGVYGDFTRSASSRSAYQQVAGRTSWLVAFATGVLISSVAARAVLSTWRRDNGRETPRLR